MGEYIYTTLEGDTWDMIALDFYDDEFLIAPLMEHNPALAQYAVFPAGIELQVPLIEQSAASSLPPWRR